MDTHTILTARSGHEFHVVELAADLLMLCRREVDPLRTALLEPKWNRKRSSIRDRTADIVRNRGQLDGEDASELLELARGALEGMPDVLVARSIAEGLELGAGQFFADWFYGRELDLGPNDPFPVAENNVREWVRNSSGSPGTRTEALDRLPRLRLAPADTRGLRISMCWLDAQLAPLEHVERMGIAVVAQPDVFATFTWERYAIAGQKLFFNVRPSDPATIASTIETLVQAAVDQRVDLLLLPELCMTADMHARLISVDAFATIPFVVAGSHHAPSDVGPGDNQATLFARGRPLATHRKFRPVIFPDQFDDDMQPSAKPVPRQEHLRVGESRITVLASGDWSVAVLICKDAMDNAVQDVLRELAVQLVLIPAMSPKTGDFSDLAQQLGRDPQSFTLVANFGETVAVVGTPAEKDRVKSYTYSDIGVLVFDREGGLIIE